MLKRVTDQKIIRELLDLNMYIKNKILASAFVKSKNTIYEGVHVMGASTDCTTSKRRYSFTNSDSNYQSPVVHCDLEDIGYIEVLSE
jgi:hypothetical protein